MKRHPAFLPRRHIAVLIPLLTICLPLARILAQESGEKLTLERAVALALESNQLVKAGAFGVEAAGARIQMARSGYLPKVTFDHTATRGNNPVYVFGSLLTQRQFTEANFALDSLNTPSPLNNFQNRFSLTQSIFDFGRTRKAVSQSRLGKEFSESELGKTQQELIFRVVKSYHDALLAAEMLHVAEEAVKSAIADRDKAEALFKSGLTVESDLLSAEVHHAAQLEERIKSQNQLRLALANLNFEMGLPLTQYFELVPLQDPRITETADLASLQAVALEKRPDFKQTRLSSRTSELAVESAKAEFLPTVNAFGSWETDSQDFASNGGNNWAAGINVRFTLFNGRTDQARLAESRFQQRRMSAFQEHIAQAIRLQIQKAYLDLETAGQRIEVSAHATRQAEEGLRIVRNRYEAGLTTITDLLRAETALVSAQTSHLRAVFDRRTSAVYLELQVGRLAPDSPVLRN